MGDRDLVGAAAHIAYEWLSVAEMSALLSGIVGSRTSAENAFLESGLVHYRCIVNFVCGDYKGRWRPGDIKPEDFLDRPWWPADEEFDRRLRGRLPGINQALAHLSWRRLDHELLWPFGLLAHEAHFAMGLFLAEAPQEAPWRPVLESASLRAASVLPPRDRWRSSALEQAPPRS